MKTIGALEKLVSGFLQGQTASPPDILWHYTNAAGFLGIFRSGRLWATNTDYLNDASEMRYARHLVLRGVTSVRSSAVNREEHEMLNLLCECIGSNVTRPVFVTSLSAEKNELSQWRAYGGSSRSFVLGFNSERLVAAIAKNTDTRFNLYKCIYDEAHSASLFRRQPTTGITGSSTCTYSRWVELFRLYGPEPALFDKSWRLPDIEKVK